MKNYIKGLEEKEIKIKERINKLTKKLIKLKENVRNYTPLDIALQKEYSINSYMDSKNPKTLHCRINLPSCFIGKKVKLVLVENKKD